MADFRHENVENRAQGMSVGLCVPHMTMENYVDSLSRWTDGDLIQKADSLRNLHNLVLYGRAVSDYGIKVLENCQKLKELHLIDTSVTDVGLGYLKNLRSLKWLSVDDAKVTDSGIIQLKDLHNLEGLQLVKTRVSDDGLAILLNFPNLEYLEISGCTISEKGVLFISRVGSLNSLRLAAPTIFDDSFLALSYCKQLEKLSFDMPMVTPEAIKEMRLRLPGCILSGYHFFRPEEKVIFLVSNFIGEGKTIINFENALTTANELLSYNPYHPGLHGARALINYRMGNLEQFRNDLRNVRDNANIYGQEDLRWLAMEFLSFNNAMTLHAAMELHHPDHYIANHLLTSGVRHPTRKEPIAYLLRKLDNACLAPTVRRPYGQTSEPLNKEQEWRRVTTYQQCQQKTLILPKELKEELKSVPWNW
jgi:hypothetical protein